MPFQVRLLIMQTQGITHAQAQDLLKQYGHNIIEDKHKVTWQKILLRQIIENKVIYLLLTAAIVAFLVGEAFTSITIAVVVVLVVVVGFIQEFRAEKAVEALKGMTKAMTRVYRNGKIISIESTHLVPSDCVVLSGGDVVPADCVIVSGKTMHVNEAALTGESQEVLKDVFPLVGEHTLFSTAEDRNRLFMGTAVLKGKCVAHITHTGMNTRLGSIANLISTSEKSIILTGKINKIVNFMIGIATVIGLASAVLLLLRADTLTNVLIVDALILFIALAVSAFPEDLPVVMMATLTTGARRMAAKNAIVNRIAIIETLGEVTVICTDKTGTLTKGQMAVREIISGGKRYTFSGSGFSSKGGVHLNGSATVVQPNSSLYLFLKTGVLCTDTNIQLESGTDSFSIMGSSTEGALLVAAYKAQIQKDDFTAEIVDEHPFDSDRKCMSVLAQEGSQQIMYTKGAPESVLQNCTHIRLNGTVHELSNTARKHLLQMNEVLGQAGMRTIACAYKHVAHPRENEEKNLTFLGIAALEDAPHEEAPEAIHACHAAGITVKMITGDQPSTAATIAKQIGITGEMLTGAEIDGLTDEELRIKIKTTAIFARVKPEHKHRIVKALKGMGEIVAMTGDGVNDAPALKEAHIGIAMGKNGTEVTRSVADITLCDDNFATIVSAVREGRVIFKNIRKFVGFQLSCNIAELITNFFAIVVGPFFGWITPLITSIQILFMNLITDNVPAIALGQTAGDPFIMHEKPRKKETASILSKSMIGLIAGLAVSMCGFALTIQYIGTHLMRLSPEIARSTTMTGFIVIQVMNSFQMRSFRKGIFTESIYRNVSLIYAAAFSIGATLLILYTPLHTLFETHPIGKESWMLIISAAIAYLVYVDIIKFIYNHLTKRTLHARIRG